MFKKLSHPMLFANDLGRAVAFYNEKLNFKIRFHHENAYASLFNEEMKVEVARKNERKEWRRI